MPEFQQKHYQQRKRLLYFSQFTDRKMRLLQLFQGGHKEMTSEDWKQVEKDLKFVDLYTVKLLIDGYEVSLQLRQISQFRNAIVVYVNGVFRGKWLTEDCEERRRFFPCKKRCLTNTNELKKMGIRSKKEIQKYKESATYNQYSSAWTNFKAMKKHFEMNNKSIEILEV
nr:MAG TPA: hypothetical protein [Caudoviricetes sp.]